ncbi:MAG: hypothetical protein COW47_00705 [Candidatus Huberarchaeum crystalense]|uniref:Uncharacterized protein n=1 Tax=Huberarchaeum crystalense TaxID=2014257 RepID=A0A2G9LJA1_HUBC1|nr:hypothetical protein [archaeon]OIP20693.1 MAG: hypothetical protein AUJ91_00595 [archaeon CG2_30_31_98]PIN66594.1 MAG: hypothetical protein COW69_01340 [Candidatus Huberarchaeum crystalense]NCS98438.1 hypothetical protein [archaeon]PIV13631.1 MAG: hypothetical protein COS45_01915 [Candidatus Huberarchaeum crystalense]
MNKYNELKANILSIDKEKGSIELINILRKKINPCLWDILYNKIVYNIDINKATYIEKIRDEIYSIIDTQPRLKKNKNVKKALYTLYKKYSSMRKYELAKNTLYKIYNVTSNTDLVEKLKNEQNALYIQKAFGNGYTTVLAQLNII